MNMDGRLLLIDKKDNVAVALVDIEKGQELELGETVLVTGQDIGKGHKIAIRDIKDNENIIKYGYPIGHASCRISAGELVHTHNAATSLDRTYDYIYEPDHIQLDMPSFNSCFKGYLRKDGSIGTRNEVWIINTVGCVNKTAEIIAREANNRFKGLTDGIFTFSHPYGCSQLGDDMLNTQKVLSALVKHPNAAGVLVLSLGCENNNLEEFNKVLGPQDEERVKYLVCQETDDEIEEGLKLIGQLVEHAQGFKRQEHPVSKLIVGLKCGGSDAFSGITGNPLLGTFSDRLIAQGGIIILTEVPEMFGAETILMNRCRNEKLFNRTVELINDFKKYFIENNQEVYENPSPGNRKGGITTLEEKSLGCVHKGGKGSVTDVIEYGGSVSVPGLNLLQAPGNDMVSATALAAAGAQLILFTTGRGNPYGAVVPTVKVSTNSGLFNRKTSWIDFNAGQLLEGKSMEDVSENFFNYVLKVASGEERTKNELNGYREISIFKNGVTL